MLLLTQQSVIIAVLMGIATLLLFFILLQFFLSEREKKPPAIIRQITLKELSLLWESEEKKKKRTIHLSQLAPLWREIEEEQGQKQTPIFQNKRVILFCEQLKNSSWFKQFPHQKAVCIAILRLLDEEGSCPSVVDLKGDMEGNWDENTYKLLARTTLLDHSINVAEAAIELLDDEETGHVIPDTVIAALGHDLGKLESIRSYLYSLGEHPLAAARPLAAVSGFNELKRKEEILQAIRLHHKMPQGLIGKTLKKADQKARQKELEEAVASLAETSEALPSRNKTEVAGHFLKTENEEETFQKQKKEKPEEANISTWFDIQYFLELLKPSINKLTGRRFVAFSMPNGYVYFQTKVIEEAARKTAEKAGNMEITTMGQRDESMRGVLLAIVNILRSENNVIATELIKEDYFGGYFLVSRNMGKPLKGYYTPFHAESFGSIAEMEQNKPKMIRDINKVEPYTNTDE